MTACLQMRDPMPEAPKWMEGLEGVSAQGETMYCVVKGVLTSFLRVPLTIRKAFLPVN